MATPLRSTFGLAGDFPAATERVTGDGVAIGLALTVDASPGYDGLEWTYSATAENRGGGGLHDDLPGVIFEGPSEVWREVAIEVTGLDINEGTIIAPEGTDAVTLALYLNSALVAISDEGFSSTIGEPSTLEFNLEAVIQVTDLDVIRFAVLSPEGTEASTEYVITEGGEWVVT